MSFTRTYGQGHDALLTTARALNLIPFDVRLLVALHERGDEGTTRDLEREMSDLGSAIRRSSLKLRARGFIVADAGPGTTRPRRGVRARFTLTRAGSQAAQRTLEVATFHPAVATSSSPSLKVVAA